MHSAETRFGDLGFAAVIKTVPIILPDSQSGVTVYSPSVSKIFVVYKIHLVNGFAPVTAVEVGLKFRSASTAIGWYDVAKATTVNGRLILHHLEGLPVFVGRAIGEDFVIDTDGKDEVRGWAQMGEARV